MGDGDITSLTRFREQQEPDELDLDERVDRLEDLVRDLRDRQVTELERGLEGMADELEEFRRRFEETDDRSWKASTRSLTAHNRVDRLLDRVNHIISRLNNRPEPGAQ